ncbi:hypothetical protein [Shewanella glacialipiscicola]|uniref:hypothetical protein n=1 Tax=Shewanella glacialipiscicola TaxID=614069 RepID=UPI003D7BA484
MKIADLSIKYYVKLSLFVLAVVPTSVMAKLENVKVSGQDAAINDGDLMSLLKQIIFALVGVAAAGYCIFSLIQTVANIIKGWQDYRNKQEDSLGEAIGKPALVGTFITAISFAVAVYLNSNTMAWLG